MGIDGRQALDTHTGVFVGVWAEITDDLLDLWRVPLDLPFVPFANNLWRVRLPPESLLDSVWGPKIRRLVAVKQRDMTSKRTYPELRFPRIR